MGESGDFGEAHFGTKHATNQSDMYYIGSDPKMKLGHLGGMLSRGPMKGFRGHHQHSGEDVREVTRDPS